MVVTHSHTSLGGTMRATLIPLCVYHRGYWRHQHQTETKWKAAIQPHKLNTVRLCPLGPPTTQSPSYGGGVGVGAQQAKRKHREMGQESRRRGGTVQLINGCEIRRCSPQQCPEGCDNEAVASTFHPWLPLAAPPDRITSGPPLPVYPALPPLLCKRPGRGHMRVGAQLRSVPITRPPTHNPTSVLRAEA